jgi:hypothetical protein
MHALTRKFPSISPGTFSEISYYLFSPCHCTFLLSLVASQVEMACATILELEATTALLELIARFLNSHLSYTVELNNVISMSRRLHIHDKNDYHVDLNYTQPHLSPLPLFASPSSSLKIFLSGLRTSWNV